MRKFILLIVLTLTAALFFAACKRAEEARSANVAQTTSQSAPQSPPSAPTPQQQPAQINAAATPQQAPTALPAPTDAPTGTARRISIEEARAAFERGQAVFVDVRLDEQYKQGHLPGAILIPLEEVAQHSGKLPRNKLIITYCA